jgi:P-type Na+/K+ transporter
MSAGTKRMVERNVIVRNLKSLEALGGVTGMFFILTSEQPLKYSDICSDKTGTLTQGKMVIRKAWIPAKGTYSIGESNDPFNPTIGELKFEPHSPSQANPDELPKPGTPEQFIKGNDLLHEYLSIASLANLADVHRKKEGDWAALGDPTEVAIQVFASRFNYNRHTLCSKTGGNWTQLAEFPFDSDVKKMSVIFQRRDDAQKFVFTKGAVERILGSCISTYWSSGKEKIDMTEKIQDQIKENVEALASQGLRVLALASRQFDDKVEDFTSLDRADVECDLIFRGLVGLYDPPRPESAHSVRQCKRAGIRVHMLTGDHPGTARAIATEVEILPQDMFTLSKDVAEAMVMTAPDFDKLSDAEIDELPVLPLVVARCTPNTKVRMIEALHRRGCYAAMVGCLLLFDSS